MSGFIAVVFWLILLAGIGAFVYRVIRLPGRLTRSVRTLSTTVEQRQADRAAGKPVSPINVIGLAGIGVAIVGIIVARTTSAIAGMGLIVVGLGLMLIGFNMLKTKAVDADRSQPGADDDRGHSQRTSLADTRNGIKPSNPDLFPGPAGVPMSAPDQSANDLRQPQRASETAEATNPTQADIPDPLAATSGLVPSTGGTTAVLRVGGTARVVSTDKRFHDKTGRIVGLDERDAEIKFRGTLGSFNFRRSDLVAVNERVVHTPRTSISTDGNLIPGAMARVITGDKRYIGRVGRIVTIDGSMATLRLDGTLGAMDFRTDDVTAI